MASIITSTVDDGERPTVVVVIGMAGSGKTTLLTSLHKHLNKEKKLYTINLDPAVHSVPFPCNIDIRDTIKYKQVMKEYKLGPNGAILTSLNLFATKFDQVLTLLEKRMTETSYVLIDTPGQIEAFNWSASGSLMLDALAVTFPTIVVYVVDLARCTSPVSFMSNMIYACSVLYKSKLPFVLVLNKADVQAPDACREWMTSYDAFADSVLERDESYMASLSRSCALVLSEFYDGIKNIAVSAATGNGLSLLQDAVKEARKEYYSDYVSWLQKQREDVQARRLRLAKEAATKFAEDRKNDEEQKEREELERFRAEVRAKRKIKSVDKPT